MNLSDLPLVLLLLPLLAAAALCSGMETALFSLTHSDRVRLSKASPGCASAIGYLLSHPRQLLVSVLLVNTCVTTAYFVISSALTRRLEHPLWQPVLSLVAVVALILFGEVIPKVLAASHRVTLALRLGRGTLSVFRALSPMRAVIEAVAVAPLARLLRPSAGDHPHSITPEELSALLEHGARRGAIDEDEQRLLAEVVELGTTRVRDVMTPRVDIRWLDVSGGPDDVAALVRETGLTRFPVVEGSPDDGVLGWADARRYLVQSGPGRSPVKIPDIIEQVHYVPDRARLDQLLDEFRRQRTHVALAVDEFGAVTGLIHIRDVVGELLTTALEVTQTPDEQVSRLGDGRWLVPGRLGVRDWEEFLGPAASGTARDRRASTVAGLILQTLGRVPKAGDTVRLGNVQLQIESMRGPVIERVIVSAADAPPDQGDRA
jgi:CBS domain containing-hemolysin-like protein